MILVYCALRMCSKSSFLHMGSEQDVFLRFAQTTSHFTHSLQIWIHSYSRIKYGRATEKLCACGVWLLYWWRHKKTECAWGDQPENIWWDGTCNCEWTVWQKTRWVRMIRSHRPQSSRRRNWFVSCALTLQWLAKHPIFLDSRLQKEEGTYTNLTYFF